MTDRRFKWDSNQESKPDIQRTNHLFAIGVDDYSSLPPLNNCVRDTQSLVTVLTEKYQFEEKNVNFLYDQDASRENILNTLDALSQRLTAKDNLVIYFAGHGYYSKYSKTGFLAPVNGKADSVASLIYNSQIRDYIRGMAVHHLFLIVDSCFSGDLILRSMDDTPQTPDELFAKRIDAFPSRWGLAAGRIEKVSDGLVGDHSPFARSLITFLDKHPADQFAVSEIIQHVKKITTYNADQTPIGGVLKKTDDQGGEFVFRKKGIETNSDPVSANPKKESPAIQIRSIKNRTSSPPEVVEPPKAEEQTPSGSNPKEQLRNLIIEGQFREALDLLEKALPARITEIILLKSRVSSLNKRIMTGTISNENAELSGNQLRSAILELVEMV